MTFFNLRLSFSAPPLPSPARRLATWHLAAALMAATLMAFISGCSDSESGDELIRLVDVDFTGVYTGTGDSLVSQNSGEPITTMNLAQSGAGLEAFDNNGNIWRGNLNRVNSDSSASFRLDGLTTENVPAQIVGELSGEGTTGSMTGTYIEPGLLGTVSASATIAEVQTNAAPVATSLSISPSGNQTLSAGQSRQFTVSGGGDNANFQWTVSNASIGQLTNNSGSTVNYTALRAGTQTLTVRSGNDSQTVNITQSGTNIGIGL